MNIPLAAAPRPRMVSSATVGVLLDAMEALGGDVDQLLGAVGLPPRRFVFDRDGTTEIGRAAFAQLARECVMHIHYHVCRRDGIKPLPVDTLRLMCLTLIACPTLEIAIRTAEEFLRVAVEGRVRTDLKVSGSTATFVLDTGLRGRQVGDQLVIINGLGTLHRIFGWLIHEEIKLERVTFDFPGETVQGVALEFFPMAPEMNSTTNRIDFPAFYLSRPVVRSYKELCDLFTLFPFDLLPPEYGAQSLTDRIRAATYLALSRHERLPDLPELAAMFGLGVPTFRRRLKAEDGNLNEIRGQCRLRLAERFLKEGMLTVKEIGFQLQYSDTASFRRAFRRWSGVSPKAFQTAGASVVTNQDGQTSSDRDNHVAEPDSEAAASL